jgi:hypothetical protein
MHEVFVYVPTFQTPADALSGKVGTGFPVRAMLNLLNPDQSVRLKSIPI